MFESTTQIRIHYALTDQMGVVYHGNYAQFFEIGRTESIRKLGLSYKEMEATGVIMPVIDMHTKFLRPVQYDELITVKVMVKELPLRHKIIFNCEIYNEKNQICTVGHVTLYFMLAATMERCNMPVALAERLFPYFETTE